MTLIRADARHAPLRPKSVRAVVTSPPYLEQRSYGDDELELGHETTLEQYVDELATMLDEARGDDGYLADDGLLWLNIGDKANGSGGAGGDWRPKPGSRQLKRGDRGARRFVDPAYELGGFLDVPGAVLRELLARGWRLRLPIVWSKGEVKNGRLRSHRAAESLRHVGRPGWSHEMIYLLAPTAARPRFYPSLLTETGSVWTFRAKSNTESDPHLAPFPDELARRCILPSTLPGDLVFDPFDGSGTVRRIALEHGRRAVGADLYAGATILTPEKRADRGMMQPGRRNGSSRAREATA